MSKRKQDSSAESLAEALSRVMVSREELDHHHRDSYDWATHEGRGDRMPRFLERAIQEVPHASRGVQRSGTHPARYQGRSRFRRVSLIMSLMGVGAGVAVSFADPERVAPFVDKAQLLARVATANFSFSSTAVAATPRLRFGEALRNYSEEASAQAARANIVVTNLTPGATLSAGARVSDTEWSLPQSGLDNLVITFPRGTSENAMHATVEIPGNTNASSGKFSVELRRADEEAAVNASEPAAERTSEAAPEPAEAVAPAVPVKAAAEDEPVRKASNRPRSSDAKVIKRKPRPSAALSVKAQPVNGAAAASQKVAATVKAPTVATSAPSQQVARAATTQTNDEGSSPSLFGLFSSFASNGLSPNALTLNSLGGPVGE